MLPLRWGGGGCPKLYSDRKAREAHLIDKTMTLEPHGISRRANSVSDIFLFSSISFSIFYLLCIQISDICNVHLLSVLIFLLQPPLKICVANRNIGQI